MGHDTFLQALFGQQSNCSRTAFDLHSEHFDSILNIPTEFQLHSSCIPELIRSECARIIRCGFEASSEYSNGVLTKNDDPARMWLEFWKCFIPADSVSVCDGGLSSCARWNWQFVVSFQAHVKSFYIRIVSFIHAYSFIKQCWQSATYNKFNNSQQLELKCVCQVILIDQNVCLRQQLLSTTFRYPWT